MTNKLGVYWSVMHRRQQDYDYFRQLQPSVFKIMDGGQPDYQFARDNLSNSLVIARDWALSEQHSDMLKDPVGTGQRHAQEWNQHQARLGFDRAKTLILGINEPRVWEPGVSEALRLYTIALCDEATRLNLRVGAMQLSVGWPDNTGPDTPPNWEPWHGVDNAIRHNNGALVLHEYWADAGPNENWGWWGGRSLKCPWQVPIVIGECGLDMGVRSADFEKQKRGWMAHLSPERYAAELAEYVGKMSADPRFVGCAVFAADFADDDWYSFDIERAYHAILSTPIPAPQPTPPTAIHLPAIENGKPVAIVDARAGANIRSGPGMQYPVLGTELIGTTLPVIGRNGEWWQVDDRQGTGWVNAKIVRVQNVGNVPVVDAPPVETKPPADKWARCLAFILRWEGGWADNPNDKGGATMKGITLGTYTRWRKAHGQPVPTKDDLRAIPDSEVETIYREWYWQESGADALPWPECLAVVDLAVNGGVDRAKEFVAEVGVDFVKLMARRLLWYTNLDDWHFFGNAWTRRCADLMRESK